MDSCDFLQLSLFNSVCAGEVVGGAVKQTYGLVQAKHGSVTELHFTHFNSNFIMLLIIK